MESTDDDLRPAYIGQGSTDQSVRLNLGRSGPKIPDLERANNNHRYRPDKLQYELHIPNSITRVGVGFSGVTILFFVSLCVTAIFSCIIFRLWLSGMHLQ